jgi:hypothetical protein
MLKECREMVKYELTSKQVALIEQSLLNHAMMYECESQEFQKTIRKDAQELYNLLIKTHNSQENETLKYYNNYCECFSSKR